MKRLISILLFVACVGSVMAIQHEYAAQSQLAKGKWVKIAVTETGICRLTYEELKNMGLNPAAVRVFGYGGAMLTQDFNQRKIDDLPAVPFYMHKGADGVFGAGDYILFYTQGLVSWEYTGSRFRHTRNPYANEGYYFLSDNAGEQLLLEPVHETIVQGEAQEVTTFSDYRVHELDSVNLIDPSGYAGGGREWYGEQLNTKRSYVEFSFDFPNVVSTTQLRAYVDLASTAEENVTLLLSIGETLRNMVVVGKGSDHIVKAKVASLDARYETSKDAKQRVNMRVQTTNAAANVYLNYVELTAECELVLVGDMMQVRNAALYGEAQKSYYRVQGATAETQVWDVTDLGHICVVPSAYANGELTFLLDNEVIHELVIVNPSRVKTGVQARRVGTVSNQDLHNLQDVEMVIITPAQFASYAEQLAAAHTEIDGLSTAVVTDEQVYNEFSSGTPDASAYRWLMKMLYDRAVRSGGVRPAYLLLFGDGTFDNRKLLPTSGNNLLLTYQSRNSVKETSAYASDDYFTWMDNNEGMNDIMPTMDLAVGRLPVNTAEQAQHVVNKLIRYMRNETNGHWKSQLCFLADDGDSNMHTRGADRGAESVRKQNQSFVVNKIYLDAYQQESTASGEKYPMAKSKLDNLLKNGVLLFDYCGHAGYNNICSENMLTAREIREMTNENLGLWVLATCNFANFDAQKTSAAEEAVLNPNGGALGVFASCRTVYAAQNEVLNMYVCDSLLAHRSPCDYPHRIGDAFRLGKNASPRDENNLPYLLLGDPAIRLHYPTDYQVTTTSLPDTLSALTINTLEGCILTDEGDTATWFNGTVNVTILDKQQTLKTLDNDQPIPERKVIWEFVDYPNTLFKGEARVEDGLFSCTFMVPKDIKYNYGQARIVYYAQDTLTMEEAIGHYEDFVVGGSSTVEIQDSVGPTLALYLNNPAFRSGDKTNEYPHFYAEIADENGINTVGSGIGHDLLLILDDDPTHSYVLNNYFTAEADSYQRGLVSYRLAEMTEGQHSLTFRAWDLLNNSSTASLQFEVVKGYALQIFSVLTYPNPVSTGGTINFVIQHDKPDDRLEARYMLFDLSGRKVWEHTQTGGDRVTLHASELGVGAGIYLYRVELKTSTTNYTSKTGKIMVY